MEKTLILKTSKLKTFILLITCSLFVVISVIVNNQNEILTWFGTIFFGIGVIVFFIQLLPNSSYLKLSEEGFEIKSLFKSNFTKWSDVDTFRVGYITTRYSKQKFVMFNYSKNHKKNNLGKKISRYLADNEALLPNNYEMKVEKLTKVMNEWKSNANQNVIQ